MRIVLFVFLLLCSSLLVQAQSYRYPVVTASAKTVSGFIPAGWHMLDSASGDLNKDKRTDYALVLEHDEKQQLIRKHDYGTDTVQTKPRILAIVMRDSTSGNLRLAEQSNTFIITYDALPNEMDDPFGDISISKGVIKIDFHFFYYMGSWNASSVSYKFRYQDNSFALIGADCSDFHRATHDYSEYSFNFLTKKWTEKKGNEHDEKPATAVWHTLELEQLKTLRTLREPFTWRVTGTVIF